LNLVISGRKDVDEDSAQACTRKTIIMSLSTVHAHISNIELNDVFF